MKSAYRCHGVSVAFLVLALAGCRGEAPPTASPASAEASVAAPRAVFVNAALGGEMAADGLGIKDVVSQFGSSDPIIATAKVEPKPGTASGGSPPVVSLSVEILDAAGNLVAAREADVTVAEPVAGLLHLEAPESGWPAGTYVARFALDGVPGWEVSFQVD